MGLSNATGPHGCRRLAGQDGGFASGGNSTLVYFGCDDCAIEAARVTEAGGSIHREKMSFGEYGFIALAIDTEGKMFGLHSMQRKRLARRGRRHT